MTTKAMTIDEMLSNGVRRWQQRPFLVAESLTLSFLEFEREVDKAARGLLALGVKVGDRVAIWMSNRIEWPIAQLAVTRCGAVLVPLNTRLRLDDLSHALNDSGAVVIITQHKSLEFDYLSVLGEIVRLRRCPALGSVVVVDGELDGRTGFMSWADMLDKGRHADCVPQPCRDAAQMAYILYTSGTTSLPKGVMLSHANLNNSLNIAGEFREHEVVFLSYPLFAITGCHNTILAGLTAGATVVIQERFDPDEALALIERHRCTVLAGVITVAEQIVNAEGFSPERVQSLWRANVFPRRPQHIPLLRRLGVQASSTGYGMTETSGPATHVSSMEESTFSSEGVPWPGNEIRILDRDGNPAPVGEAGAIVVRSRQVMLGYFNNAEATRKAIDADGCLHTGDIGRFNADGTLTWIGRANEVYKSSGFNVAALEVEAFLSQHPGVAEVAVIGVTDPSKGEVGAAFVVARPGHAVDKKSVVQFCKGRIASYKIPGHVIALDSFPKTASGKVRKVELRSRYFS